MEACQFSDWGSVMFNRTVTEKFAGLPRKELSPTHLGLLTGFFVVLMIGTKLTNLQNEFKKINRYVNVFIVNLTQIVSTAFCIGIFLSITPLLVPSFGVFFCYRKLVETILRRKHGVLFAGLLEGADCVWALEEDTSNSVVNSLAIVEVSQNHPFELLSSVRSNVATKLTSEPTIYSKMLYKRKCFMGYFYWIKPSCQIDFDSQIRFLDEIETDSKFITREQLYESIGRYCNTPLPSQHEASWEILVGKQPVYNGTTKSFRYPILFRIHHTLGDGYALVQLLIRTIADRTETVALRREKFKNRCNTELFATCDESNFDFTLALHVVSWLRHTFVAIKKIVAFLITIPESIIKQGIRKNDTNALHGSQLSGDKVVAWWSDDDGRLFQAVKNVKNRLSDTRFSDVLMTAVSTGFYNYFAQNNSEIPPFVTAVVPTRAELPPTPSNAENLSLNNRFTVGLLTVPLSDEKNSIENLEQLKLQSKKLRESPDFAINYWIMRILSAVLPVPLLRPVLYSSQSTFVISNMPGPAQISICAGHRLTDLVFWIPNRGTTGIGVSILSYSDRLQIGILSDKALIPSSEHIELLLNGMVQEIHYLDVITHNE